MPEPIRQPWRSARAALGAAAFLSLFVLAGAASAEPGTARARYDEGKRAYDAGDYVRAAAAFADADELTPNAAVLELAIASSARAKDPVRGMTLVERAERRGLTGIAEPGRRAFADKVGRVDVGCPGATRCTVEVDGVAVAAAAGWYPIGEHSLKLEADGNVERFTLTVMAGHTTTVRPTRLLQLSAPPIAGVAPAAAVPRLGESREGGETDRRLPPAWFFGAVGVTGALGIASSISAADMFAKHADFERNPADSRAAADGRGAQARTNVLVVSTIVVALGTLALGTLFTRWHSTRPPEVAHAF